MSWPQPLCANISETPLLEPGTLWAKVTQRTEHALHRGVLQSLPTNYAFLEQDGIHFLVRVLSILARKDEIKKKKDTPAAAAFDPFLPYDEDLFVADVSDTHICLLNKFNVVNYHLLIVTRRFEDQESLLTLQDFAALWACMNEFESLAFYNAGKIAGASQRHKHLQLVPLPLAPTGPAIPIEPALVSVRFDDMIGTATALPFAHAFVRIEPHGTHSSIAPAEAMLNSYHTMLRALGLQASGDRQSGAYNLLATRQWMLLVPRSRECFKSISVNALGFAGALLVQDERQMKVLKDYGPMMLLKGVAIHYK